MKPNFYLSPVAISLTIAITSSANAAQPLILDQSKWTYLQQQFAVDPAGKQSITANSSPDALRFIRKHTDNNLVNHIRMQQVYRGIPVLGGYAILHSHETEKNLQRVKDIKMNGTVYEGLETELGKLPVDFEKKKNKALAHFEAGFTDSVRSEGKVTAVIHVDENNRAHWAYKVSVLLSHNDGIPERPTAILDASSFKPLVRWNDIKTGYRGPAKGMGFGGNPKTGSYTYGKDLPLLDITRSKALNQCYMENAEVRIVDMKNRFVSPHDAMQFSCTQDKNNSSEFFMTGYQGNGYDQINGAYSPSNDALYAGYIIKHMYLDWYNVQVLVNPDASPMKLIMRVHYGKGYENAYWDGKQMTFGDGDDQMYPLVTVGISAHEVSHGFTEQHSGLEYYGHSGGMNESFSDMAAQAAEFYATGQNSWMMGADIMKESSGYEALRYMDEPGRDGSSIDSAKNYRRGMDVHFSSGVFNHLFYLMSHQAGWDVRKAFDVMVKANMDYWTPRSTFDQGGCGVLSAAADLHFATDDIKKSLDTVGVDYTTCKV